MQVKRFKVTYKDTDGNAQETKGMSRAEAEETARRLRVQPVSDVHVVPVSRPQPKMGFE